MSAQAIQTKIDKRATTWDQMKALMEEVGDNEMSGEQVKRFNALDADVAKLTSEIDVDTRFNDLGKALDKIEIDPIVNGGKGNGETEGRGQTQYDEVFWRYVRNGLSDLEMPEKRALQAGFSAVGEQRAQGTGTTAGGYFIPQGFRQIIIETLKYFGGVRQVSTVITTDTGQVLPWPTNDDTANVGAILAENTQLTQQDVVLGQAQLGAYTYTSKLVLVSWQLLQDSIFNLEDFLGRKLGQRLGRIQNTHFTTGTGVGQPLGIQTNAIVGATGATGQTATVLFDDLITLKYSVDVAYRQRAGSGVGFMMNDQTMGKIRKLKDTQNRPLWEPSYQVGLPDQLLGERLVLNNDMPQMAANTKSILFGDFASAYVIRDVLGVQMVRLDERYADFLQSGFFGFNRTDATLQDAGAIRAYANSAT